jgi:hypothetical protein
MRSSFMTVFQKSLGLWIGGALAGALISIGANKSPFLGGVLGAMLVGGVGDKMLEEARDAEPYPVYPGWRRDPRRGSA